MTAKPELLHYDTVDDRREVHRLLGRLPPRERVAFLSWACRQATLPTGADIALHPDGSGSMVHPQVAPKTWELMRQAQHDSRADEKLTFDVYFDVWLLATQYQVSLRRVLMQLEGLVRRRFCPSAGLHTA